MVLLTSQLGDSHRQKENLLSFTEGFKDYLGLTKQLTSFDRNAFLRVADFQLCKAALAWPTNIPPHGRSQADIHDGMYPIVDGVHNERYSCITEAQVSG